MSHVESILTRNGLSILLLTGGIVGLCPAPAPAQILNPGVLQQQNLPQNPRPNRDPETTPSPAPSPEVPAETTAQTYQIQTVKFQGNTKISSEELAKPFAALLGQPVTREQLQAAVDAVTQIYVRQGYFLSRAALPEVDLDAEIPELTIQILEGYIEKIDVRTTKPLYRDYIQKVLEPLLSERPLQYDTFTRQLLVLEDAGGSRLRVSFNRGSEAGASALLVRVQTVPLTINVGVDSQIPQQLGSVRSFINFDGYAYEGAPTNVVLGGSMSLPSPSGSSTVSALVRQPLGPSGTTLQFLGAYSTTNSRELNLLPDGTSTTGGESYFGSVGVRTPLILTRDRSLYLTASFDAQNSSSYLFLSSISPFNVGTDRVRALRLRLDYSESSPGQFSFASGTLSQGLDIFGATSNNSPGTPLSNPFGQASFTTFRLYLRHDRSLTEDGLGLTLKASGQISANSLLVSEQFFYGGQDMGRAFPTPYISGDSGFSTSIELNYAISTDFGSIQPYIFGDYGQVYLQQAAPGIASTLSAATYGLGIRANLNNGISGEVGWGIPNLNTFAPAAIGAENSFVYFRVNIPFRFRE